MSEFVWVVELPKESFCLSCHRNLCTCEQRRDGTWECNLLAKRIRS